MKFKCVNCGDIQEKSRPKPCQKCGGREFLEIKEKEKKQKEEQ